MARAVKAAVVLGSIPAAAISNLGSLQARAQRQTIDPRVVLEASFSQLFDRDLSASEVQQIDIALSKYLEERTRPKILTVAYNSEDNRTEIRPVFCLYGRVSVSFSKVGGLKLEGFGANGELVGCILTNDSNPLAWSVRDFRSYIMQGIGGASMGPNGGLGGGIMLGIYMGPTNTTKPMIGKYVYGRINIDKSIFRGGLMYATGENNMSLALANGGVEFSWKSLIDTIRILPKMSVQDFSKYSRIAKRDFDKSSAQGRFGVGTIVNVREFPWFERIFVQGMNPIAAFSDMPQYLAANN